MVQYDWLQGIIIWCLKIFFFGCLQLSATITLYTLIKKKYDVDNH